MENLSGNWTAQNGLIITKDIAEWCSQMHTHFLVNEMIGAICFLILGYMLLLIHRIFEKRLSEHVNYMLPITSTIFIGAGIVAIILRIFVSG